MATPAAVLAITVNANTTAANANLAKTDAALRGTAAAGMQTTSATSKASSALKKMGTMAKWGGAALTAGFIVAAKKSVDTTNELTKSTLLLQKNFGLSGKAASEWAGVARARGADSTKLGMAFKTLATQITAARDGSESSIASFQKLGFTQADIAKASRDTQFGLKMVADGLNQLPPGADKAAISGKLFGRGWATIAPVLRDGSEAMQDQLDTVAKYGGVLAGKTLKQQEEFLAVQRESKIAWQGMQVTLGTALTPALEDVNKQFQKIARIMASDKLTDDEKFSKVADILEKDFSTALDVIVKMIPTIASRVGEQAPKIAKGLVEGFLHANVWGQLLIGSWLISKMGGWGAISALGKKIGTRVGTGVAAGTAASGAAGGAGAGAAGGAAAGGLGLSPLGAAALGISAAGAGVYIEKKWHPVRNLVTKEIPDAFEVLAKSAHHLTKTSTKDLRLFADQNDDTFRVASRAVLGLERKYPDLITAGHQMSKQQRNAWIDVALTARENGDITQKQLLKLTNAFTKNGQQWREQMRKVADETGQSAKRVKQTVGDMGFKVSKDYEGMVEATGQGLDLLTSNTNSALKALGIKQEIKFSATHAGGKMAGEVGHPRQKGGPIPGAGSGDKVHAMLEPGEFVMNRNAVKGIGAARLEAMNKALPRFAKGGVVEQALGPYTIPPIQYDPNHAGGNSHVHADFFTVAQALAYGHKAQGMGWSVGEYTPKQGNPFHFGPITTQHQSPGHYDGTAWDANQGVVESRSAVAALAKLFNSGVAVAAMGAAVEKIKRVLLEGPDGPLRDMGQKSLDKVRNAANAFISKQAPKMNTTGADFPVGAGSVSRGDMRGLLKAHGMPNWTGWIAMAESMLDPNAVSSAGARGLFQIMPFWGGGDKLFDPNYNVGKAKHILDTQGLSAWDPSKYAGAIPEGWGPHQGQPFRKGGMVNMPPFAGSFGDGGTVPGPIGAARTAIVHGGEPIGTPEIHLHFAPGTEWLRDFVQVEVGGAINGQTRLRNQKRRMART